MSPTILVTGGAGYIGAHACVALIAAGFTPLVLDNLCNSSAESLRRVGRISGVEPRLVVADIRDAQALDALFAAQPVAAVMHFAGLKAVGESTAAPLRYYDNNVGGSVALLQAMQRAGVRTLIFSSSATVYGEPSVAQFREDMRCDPVNPYGRGKWMIEQMLGDLAASEPGWRIAALRYFNPVGAHPSGLIGEDPRGVPDNLMPYITQVAVGRLPALRVFGDDWPTRGWQRRARLHPRDGSGRGPRGRAAPPARARAATADAEPGQRSRHLGAATAARVRAGDRPRAAARDRRAPPRRHRRVLGRSDPRGCRSWAGARSATCPRCAPMPGAGSRPIRAVTPTPDLRPRDAGHG